MRKVWELKSAPSKFHSSAQFCWPTHGKLSSEKLKRLWINDRSDQSRDAETMDTRLNRCSSGRVWPSSSHDCSKDWNSLGVFKDRLDSTRLAICANHWSQSSWLWPLCKNRNSGLLHRESPVSIPPHLNRQLFLISREVLSDWIITSYSRKSQKLAKVWSTWDTTSQQKLLSFFMNGSVRLTKTPWPCTIAA